MDPATKVLIVFLISFIVIFVGTLMILARAKLYCPKCMKGVNPKTIDMDNVATHICPDCGSKLKV